MVAMRLNGGEEIIGKFVKQDESTITLARPLALAMTQNGIAMTPHMIMAEPTGSLPYNKSLIITMTVANKAAVDNYIKSTTGIQPAKAVPNIQV
jgi:hypothetical protein